jgi:DUF1680 family protein
VNLFVGSQVTVDRVAGTRVQLVQATDYPWNGRAAITVNPAEEKPFRIRIRVPERNVSQLYTASPPSGGLTELAVNCTPVTPVIERGYAVQSRSWKAGDKIEFVLPLEVQPVKARDRIAATRGRVALRYGPLIYNLESVDQDVERVLSPDAELSTRWQADLLVGVPVSTPRGSCNSSLSCRAVSGVRIWY